MKAFNISNSCFDHSDKYKRFKKTTSSTKHFPEHNNNTNSQALLYETFRTSKMNQSLTSSLSNNPTKAGSTLPLPKNQSNTSININRFNPKMSLPSISKSMSKTYREPTIINLKYAGYNNTSLYAFRNTRNIKKVAVVPHQIKECIQTKEMPEDLYGEKIVDMIYSNMNNNDMHSKSERTNRRFGNGETETPWCLFDNVVDSVIGHCVEYRSKNNNVISRNVIQEFYEEEIQKVKNELCLDNTHVDDKDNDNDKSKHHHKYKHVNTKDDISSINEKPSELETSYDKIMLKTLNGMNDKITMNDIEYIKHKVKTHELGLYNNIIIPQLNNSDNKDKLSLLHEILFRNNRTTSISNIIKSVMTQRDTNNTKQRKIKQFRFTHNKSFIPYSERHNDDTLLSRNDSNDNHHTKLSPQKRSCLTKRNIQVHRLSHNQNKLEHSVFQDKTETNFKEFQKNSCKVTKNNSRNRLSQFHHNNNGSSSAFGASIQNDVSTKEETSITNITKRTHKAIAKQTHKLTTRTVENNLNNSKERNENSVIRKDNSSSTQIHRKATHKRSSIQVHRKTTHKRSSIQNDTTTIEQVNNNIVDPCSPCQGNELNIQPEQEQEEDNNISFNTGIHFDPNDINSNTKEIQFEHMNTLKQSPQPKRQSKTKSKSKLKPLQLRHYKTSYFPYLNKNLFLKQNTYQSFLFSRIAFSDLNQHHRSNTAKQPHKHHSKYNKLRLGLLNSTTFINDYLIYSPSQSSSMNTSPLSSFLSDQHTNTYNNNNILFKYSHSSNESNHMQIKLISTQQHKHSKGFFNVKPKSRFVNYRKRTVYGSTSVSSSSAVALNKRLRYDKCNSDNKLNEDEKEEESKDKGENVSQLQKFIEMINKAKNQGEDCYIKELTEYLDGQFAKTNAYKTKLHEDRINKFKFDLTHKLHIKHEVSQAVAKGIQFKDITTFYTKHLPYFKST